jgi:hypothetical protein
MLRISWLAEQLLVCQDGLCLMELVNNSKLARKNGEKYW